METPSVAAIAHAGHTETRRSGRAAQRGPTSSCLTVRLTSKRYDDGKEGRDAMRPTNSEYMRVMRIRQPAVEESGCERTEMST